MHIARLEAFEMRILRRMKKISYS